MKLPPELQAIADAWSFSPTEELPGGHCSRIFANESLAMKAPFVGEEMTSGFDAALALQQAGGPRIFHSDRDSAVVLMERLTPGTMLNRSGLDELACQEVFVALVRRISRLPVQGAMELNQYFEFEHPLLDSLMRSNSKRVFLHGDLHHENILDHQGEWRPIDPKGLVGDPNFEPIAFLRNPIGLLPQIEDLEAFTESRIRSIADKLGLDAWRIAAWGVLDRLEGKDGPPDDAWTKLYFAFEAIETRLRP